jgi:hypothetical protein
VRRKISPTAKLRVFPIEKAAPDHHGCTLQAQEPQQSRRSSQHMSDPAASNRGRALATGLGGEMTLKSALE